MHLQALLLRSLPARSGCHIASSLSQNLLPGFAPARTWSCESRLILTLCTFELHWLIAAKSTRACAHREYPVRRWFECVFAWLCRPESEPPRCLLRFPFLMLSLPLTTPFLPENVHALEGLACRKRVAPASSPALHACGCASPSRAR